MSSPLCNPTSRLKNLPFAYTKTPLRFVSRFRGGVWEEGSLTEDASIVLNESAGVLQYSQSCFEGLKAYETKDGRIVCFRPDLNAARMAQSAAQLEMPVYPEEKFLKAVKATVLANRAFVPPYGSGAALYLRPFMFAAGSVLGVKPPTNTSSAFSPPPSAPISRAA